MATFADGYRIGVALDKAIAEKWTITGKDGEEIKMCAYKEDHSDETVAAELGVKKSTVQSLRQDEFGKLKPAPGDGASKINAADANLLAEINAKIDTLSDQMTALQGAVADLIHEASRKDAHSAQQSKITAGQSHDWPSRIVPRYDPNQPSDEEFKLASFGDTHDKTA